MSRSRSLWFGFWLGLGIFSFIAAQSTAPPPVVIVFMLGQFFLVVSSPSMRNEYKPDRVSPPCETLQDCLEERTWSAVTLSAKSGVSIEMCRALLKGETKITPDIAAGLSRALGTSVQFWINRQENYDQWVTQNEGNKR